MSVVLDAGAFLAAERGSRRVNAVLLRERAEGRSLWTHGGVVAQVWRGGVARQVPLARLLAQTEVVPLDDALGRPAGLLLRTTGGRDAIDAAVVGLLLDGDEVLTSDPDDIAQLAGAARLRVHITVV